MALIISSFGKMLLIFMVIWDYKQLEYSWLVSIIVLASNTEALSGTELANISDPKLVKLNISYNTSLFEYSIFSNAFDHIIWYWMQATVPIHFFIYYLLQ
jgi:hypothetical protein